MIYLKPLFLINFPELTSFNLSKKLTFFNPFSNNSLQITNFVTFNQRLFSEKYNCFYGLFIKKKILQRIIASNLFEQLLFSEKLQIFVWFLLGKDYHLSWIKISFTKKQLFLVENSKTFNRLLKEKWNHLILLNWCKSFWDVKWLFYVKMFNGIWFGYIRIFGLFLEKIKIFDFCGRKLFTVYNFWWILLNELKLFGFLGEF